MSIYQRERGKMISNNIYLRFDTFDDEKSVLNFIKEEKNFKANSKTWKKDIYKLLRYKKKHLRNFGKDNQYRNIFGYYLKIMIPDTFDKRVDEFVRETMLEIDKRFLKDLYVYKIITEGKGRYVEIICFTRYVYKRANRCLKKYQRDYYYNQKTKKLCKKDHPDAVLKAKKGDLMLDSSGHKIYEIVEVKAVEDRIFVYKTIQELTRRLKNAVATVIKDNQYHELIVNIVSRITIDKDDSSAVKKYKQQRNIVIRKINEIIRSFIEHMKLGNLLTSSKIEEVNEEWCKKVDEMAHEKSCSFDDMKDYLYKWWQQNIIEVMF